MININILSSQNSILKLVILYLNQNLHPVETGLDKFPIPKIDEIYYLHIEVIQIYSKLIITFNIVQSGYHRIFTFRFTCTHKFQLDKTPIKLLVAEEKRYRGNRLAGRFKKINGFALE